MDVRGKRHSVLGLHVPGGLLILWTLAACVTSHVIVGQARTPIGPDQVRIYLQPPARSEEIALLQTSSRGAFAVTAQARMDKVVERLKKEAASLGANGILIRAVGEQSSGSSLITDFADHTRDRIGTGIAVSVLSTGGSAVAIYVPEPSAGSY